MITTKRTVLPLVAIACLLAAVSPAAEEEQVERSRPERRHGELVSVFSGDIYVPEDVVQYGDVVCIGASAVVHGDVRAY